MTIKDDTTVATADNRSVANREYRQEGFMKEISFSVRRDEMEIINRIANRALNIAIGMRIPHKQQDFAMDITCVHANGNPLRLRELLEADEFNFVHDVFGIRRHLNRETGELEDRFVPRFSSRAG